MGGGSKRYLSQVLQAGEEGAALVGAQARDVVGTLAEDVEEVEHGQHHLHVRGGQQRRQVLRQGQSNPQGEEYPLGGGVWGGFGGVSGTSMEL